MFLSLIFMFFDDKNASAESVLQPTHANARSISFHLASPCFSNVLHTSNVGCVVEGVELDQATAQARWSGALCYLWKHRSSIKSYFQLLKNMFSIIIYLIFLDVLRRAKNRFDSEKLFIRKWH